MIRPTRPGKQVARFVAVAGLSETAGRPAGPDAGGDVPAEVGGLFETLDDDQRAGEPWVWVADPAT